MEQMILSKNKTKQNKSWPRRADLGFSWDKGEEKGWMDGHFGDFLDANFYIWNGCAMGPYCTAQGNVCY